MAAWIYIVVLWVWVIGCATAAPARIESPTSMRRPPTIESIMDLGAINAAINDDTLDEFGSDGRFTPGEYVLIAGENLADQNVQVSLANQSLPVAAYLHRGVVVRLPSRIAYRQRLTLAVKTPVGRVETVIEPQGYIILSDPVTEEIRFFRTTRLSDSTDLLEPECDAVALPGARFHILSRSGGFLYGIPQPVLPEDAGSMNKSITIIHLGAKNHPQEIGEIPFTSNGIPVAVMADPKRDRFFMLTTSELFVYDAENEQLPRLKATISLDDTARSGYSNMSLMKQGAFVVLQDSLNNRLSLVQTAPQLPLRMLGSLQVTDDTAPRLVDLMVDGEQDTVLHVVEGLNVQLDRILSNGLTPNVDPRLLTYRLNGDALALVKETPVGEGTIPLFFGRTQNGAQLLSMVDTDIVKLIDAKHASDGVKGAAEVLLNALNLGQVVRIDSDGAVTPFAHDRALFLTMASPPDNIGATSLMMRIGVRKFPPSVGVKLSLVVIDGEGKVRDTHTLRNLSWQVLCPPYRVPQVTLQ